jgi:hypothetical protein
MMFQGHRWFRIPNKKLCATVAVLLLCQNGFGTALVVLVSGRSVVLGADGKGVHARTDDMKRAATTIEQKVAILRNRFLISTSGTARIDKPIDATHTKTMYDFVPWAQSLPVKDKSSVYDVAKVVEQECSTVFRAEWKFLVGTGKPIPILNLSGDPSQPWVQYYVAGVEFLGPQVYWVALNIDYAKRRLNNPTITQIYPPLKNVTTLKNIFVRSNGKKGGGMDQLQTGNTPIQKRYLKLYDKEVGAAVYDEPLDVEGLAKLAKIMLTVEIETTPKEFSFPILVCSITPNRSPTCDTYPLARGKLIPAQKGERLPKN